MTSRTPPGGQRPPRTRNGRDRGHAGAAEGDERRGPRRPPPEATGHEAEWLFKLRAEAVPVRVELTDGSVVRGVIEYYDRDLIKIQRERGPHLLLRKPDVRLLEEDDGSH